MSIVTGLFNDKESAERAYREASQSGYTAEEINVVMSEDTRERYYGKHATLETEVGSKAAEGASIGGAVGGTLGAIAAAVAAIGTTLLVPGLGIWVAGPIAAAVAGAGAGGVSGGIVGALIGWSIPEDRLKAYESGIKEGGILLGLKPRNEEDRAHFEKQWSNPAITSTTSHSGMPSSTSHTSTSSAGTIGNTSHSGIGGSTSNISDNSSSISGTSNPGVETNT